MRVSARGGLVGQPVRGVGARGEAGRPADAAMTRVIEVAERGTAIRALSGGRQGAIRAGKAAVSGGFCAMSSAVGAFVCVSLAPSAP